jgi:hypothetical protein
VVAVWALLIASADRNGLSELTVPFVASVLRIDNERVERAFSVLSAPDPRSRNKEAEGRRIVSFGDGWLLVSHRKYRERASKQAAAERQARYVAKKKALEEEAAMCEEVGCTGPVVAAAGGRKVCSAHAFSDAGRQPGEEG